MRHLPFACVPFCVYVKDLRHQCVAFLSLRQGNASLVCHIQFVCVSFLVCVKDLRHRCVTYNSSTSLFASTSRFCVTVVASLTVLLRLLSRLRHWCVTYSSSASPFSPTSRIWVTGASLTVRLPPLSFLRQGSASPVRHYEFLPLIDKGSTWEATFIYKGSLYICITSIICIVIRLGLVRFGKVGFWNMHVIDFRYSHVSVNLPSLIAEAECRDASDYVSCVMLHRLLGHTFWNICAVIY